MNGSLASLRAEGLQALRKGDFDQAIELLARAVAMDERNAAALARYFAVRV